PRSLLAGVGRAGAVPLRAFRDGTIDARSCASAMSKLGIQVLLAVAIALGGGCPHQEPIPGTTVADTKENRKSLDTVETYRQRLSERDVEGLLVLASERYFEDSGTPRADDDYGYQGLKQVLTGRLSRVRALHYEIQYRNVRITGERAEVEVFLNGSFDLLSE